MAVRTLPRDPRGHETKIKIMLSTSRTKLNPKAKVASDASIPRADIEEGPRKCARAAAIDIVLEFQLSEVSRRRRTRILKLLSVKQPF